MKLVSLVLISWALVACGGGSGNDVAGAAPEGATAVSPQFNRATGWAVASGQSAASSQVVIRDATGRESVGTTLADGSFNLDVTGLAYPALIRVVIAKPETGQVATLYGALVAPPSGNLAVSALTTAVVSGLANGDADVLFAALGASSSTATAITSSRIAAAEKAVRSKLPKLASPDLLGQALPEGSGFLSAQLQTVVAGLDDFLKKLSASIASLGGAAASAVEPLKVGCDVPTLATLAGTLRPECGTTPNRPVSETVAGYLAPLERARPGNPAAHADELAGVDRGNSWKFFNPAVSTSLIVSRLVPKLKSRIEDMWSNNAGILFPESFGLDSRSVDELVKSVVDIQWRSLPKRLTVGDVSNITFEYQMLRQRLGNAESASNMFFPLALDAVSLATPSRIDPTIALTPIGSAVEAFARGWLLDPANRRKAAPAAPVAPIEPIAPFNSAAAITALDDLINEIMGQSSANVLQLSTRINAAADALPSAYATLALTAKNVAAWHVDFYGCTTLSTFDLDIACRTRSMERLQAVLDGYLGALIQARAELPTSTATQPAPAATTAGTTETAGQFYQRFLVALAAFLNESYEQRFDSAFTLDRYAGGVSYSAVVITAELHDTALEPCLFLAQLYCNADRSALLYRVPGEAVRFGPLKVDASLGEGMVAVPDLMIAPIVYEELLAPPLNMRTGSRLTRPLEVVVTSPGFAPFSAWVVTLACSSADTACMSRLARSRIAPPIDTITPSLYHFGFAVHGNSIRAAGGLPEFSFPVDLR